MCLHAVATVGATAEEEAGKQVLAVVVGAGAGDGRRSYTFFLRSAPSTGFCAGVNSMLTTLFG
jgi:hypothetical protein